MKIGIITWKLYNYGTALQAYALNIYLNRIDNIECVLLNYSLPSSKKNIKVNKKSIKSCIKKMKNRVILVIKSFLNRRYSINYIEEQKLQSVRFSNFYKSIPSDNHLVSVVEKEYFDSAYDGVIVGSDQVWNPKYFNSTYFLDFVNVEKRYAYAPSIGVATLTENERCFFKSQLKWFQKISVREATGKHLLEMCNIGKDIAQVLDPTLLLKKEDWCSLLGLKEKKNNRYIFVYTLSTNRWYKKIIEIIKKQLAIEEVVYITSTDNAYFYKNKKLFMGMGPQEFLEMMLNAAYVITDSFHGVCFSIIFNKPFSCLQRFNNSNESENSRVYDLLNELKLNNRIVKNSRDSISNEFINYEQVNGKLNFLREKSTKYIFEIVEDIESKRQMII